MGRQRCVSLNACLFRLVLSVVISIAVLSKSQPEGQTAVVQKFAVDQALQSAVDSFQTGDILKSYSILQDVLVVAPDNVDANQFIGAVLVKMKEPEKGSAYLSRAVELSQWLLPHVVANYIESLRSGNDLLAGWTASTRAIELHPNNTQVLFNAGLVARDMRDYSTSFLLLQRTVQIDGLYYQAWEEGGEVLMAAERYPEAESYLSQANSAFPGDARLSAALGVSKHHQNKFSEALALYEESLSIRPDSYGVRASMGAVFQSLGRSQDAVGMYLTCMPFRPDDAGVRSNYGVLLGTMGRKEEGLRWVLEAFEINPLMESTLTNLGGFYQDDGMLEKAAEYFQKASVLSKKPSLLLLRIVLMLSPISSSWEAMIEQRNKVEASLLQLLSSSTVLEKQVLDSSLDRIHFYLVYHGLNDRRMQELIVSVYEKHIVDFAYVLPKLLGTGPSMSSLQVKTAPFKKVRVAFLSLFFGIFEPHGMLLDGVMKSLPRSQFEVIALPIARTDGKPLSPSIMESCDEVFETTLHHSDVHKLVSSLDIDILVFADTMSEPMTHFLAHTRLAKVQMAFWGNPITSGSASIDYFVSSELLEHPFRTRMPVSDEPYTEQVVLLEGQGVWYYTPESPLVALQKAGLPLERLAPSILYNKSHFNLSEDAFVYFCPQSVFKMHPLFDTVFRDILEANPEGHIVITGGRRPMWTDTYMARLRAALGEEAMRRLHLIDRVSAEKFLALLKIADVILHPFPFDGSRTSADGLIAGIPVLTMPTEYLRGRMGATFLRTMNMPELVARSRSEYVRIAVKLGADKAFYSDTVAKIKQSLGVVWEDMEYAFSWYQLLSRASGLRSLRWDAYIVQTGRPLAHETEMRDLRRANRAAFDKVWGRETWLLEGGVAHLEAHLTSNQRPRLFTDWTSATPHASPDQGLLSKAAIPHVYEGGGGGRPHRAPKGGHNDAVALSKMRLLARTWQLEESYQVALALLGTGRYLNDPQFLLDIGGVQYFRGEYDSAYHFCNRAASLVPDSILAQQCLGVAGMYLEGERRAALAAFREAVRQQDLQRQRSAVGAATLPGALTSDVFTFTDESLLINLLSALKGRGQHRECVRIMCDAMDLPLPEKGGAYVIYFASVAWSPHSGRALSALELQLSAAGNMALLEGRGFSSEILRIQRGFSYLLNLAMFCIPLYLEDIDPTDALLDTVMAALMAVVNSKESLELPAVARRPALGRDFIGRIESSSEEGEKGIVLITQYFRSPSKDSTLQRDIDSVLAINLANPLISSIVLLTEELLDLPAGFDSKGKVQQVVIGERLTFSSALSYANERLQGRTVILANADIYFDESLGLLGDPDTLDLGGGVLGLLKWTENGSGSASLTIRTDSQDAWVFQPPVAARVVEEASFVLGVAKCDNRIAEILHSHGHNITNPAFAIHAIEVHNSERVGAGFYGMKGSPSGPYRDVLLSDRKSF